MGWAFSSDGRKQQFEYGKLLEDVRLEKREGDGRITFGWMV
jgi:hypothetical protein